jgi:hypothetical protein
MTENADPMESLRNLWQLDEEWVVSNEDGFSHWWHRLEQVITRSVNAQGLEDWAATTFVIREVSIADAALRACHDLNQRSAGWAYIFDAEERAIQAVTKYAGMPDWDQPRAQWITSALVSYWHAETVADGLATLVGGQVDVSGPRGVDSPRGVADSLLTYVQSTRARPEWVFNPTVASLPNMVDLSATVTEWIGSDVRDSDSSTERLRLICSDSRQIAEWIAAGTDPAYWRVSARYEVSAELIFREPFGQGFVARIRMPLAPNREETPAATANRLNGMVAAESTVNGAYIVTESNLWYEVFVPAFTLRNMQVGRSHPDGLSLLSGIISRLPHALAYADEAGIGGPDVPEARPIARQAVDLLEAFNKPAREALAGVPSPAPDRADRRYLWVQDPIDLCHFGIFNPMGPTLNTLQLAPLADGRHALLFLMRHPFASAYKPLGYAATVNELRALITGAVPSELGSLPDFVWFVADEDLHEATVSAMRDVLAATSQNDANADSDLAWDALTLRHFAGRAWDRLNSPNEVPQPGRPYVGAEGYEYQAPPGVARDFEDWFYAVTDMDNVVGTLLAFPSAWDGAIGFQEEHGNLASFDLD